MVGDSPAEQSPNRYRLLGINVFAGDADVIESAADSHMAHLRNYQTGPRAALAHRLLNDVSAAGVCLLDPAKRDAYGRQLRRQLGRADSASTTQPVASAPTPVPQVVPSTSTPQSFAAVSVKRRAKRKPPCAQTQLLLEQRQRLFCFCSPQSLFSYSLEATTVIQLAAAKLPRAPIRHAMVRVTSEDCREAKRKTASALARRSRAALFTSRWKHNRRSRSTRR